MALNSAWSRGLCYGAVFGGIMAIFPALALILSEAPLEELALAGATIMGIWGTLGFLAGFCTHQEPRSDSDEQRRPVVETSLVKRLLYRFVAGMLLDYIAAMVVCGLGFALYALWEGGFDAAPNRRITEHDRRMFFVAFCGMVGAETGALAGCWIGSMLAPGGNILGPIARIAFIAGALGILTGSWIGALIGLLCRQYGDFNSAFPIAAAVAGALAGIGSAIFVRLRIVR
jgi:hypothetical protein